VAAQEIEESLESMCQKSEILRTCSKDQWEERHKFREIDSRAMQDQPPRLRGTRQSRCKRNVQYQVNNISIFTIFLLVLVQACTSTESLQASSKTSDVQILTSTFIKIISINIQPEFFLADANVYP